MTKIASRGGGRGEEWHGHRQGTGEDLFFKKNSVRMHSPFATFFFFLGRGGERSTKKPKVDGASKRPCSQRTSRKIFARTGCVGLKIWREPRFSGKQELVSLWRLYFRLKLRWPSHFSAEDCQNPPPTPGSFRHRFLPLFSFFFLLRTECFIGLSVKGFSDNFNTEVHPWSSSGLHFRFVFLGIYYLSLLLFFFFSSWSEPVGLDKNTS